MTKQNLLVWNTLSTHLFGVIFVFEVDKGEASGAARLLVVDYADAGQGAIFGEDFSQVSLCGVQAQAKHTQATVRVRVCLQDKGKRAPEFYNNANKTNKKKI